MTNKYPGLFFYFDWLEAIEQMGCEDGYSLVLNLYHFMKSGTQPTPLQGANNIVQRLCLSQLERNKDLSEKGRRAAELRYASGGKQKTAASKQSLYQDPEDDPEEIAFIRSCLHMDVDPMG